MKTILRFLDGLLVLVLSLFGLSCCDNPVAEYGAPNADYQLKGTVIDSVTNNPLEGIRVIREEVQDSLHGDTIYTDANGKYNFAFNDFDYANPVFNLKVEDIDGDEHGGSFEDQELTVQITGGDWVDDGDGDWYGGKAVKITDIKMKPRE